MEEAPHAGHDYWWPEHVNGRRPREVHRVAVAGLRSCRPPQTADVFRGRMGAMTGDMDPRPNPEREAAAPLAVVPRAPGVVVPPPRDCATPLVGGDIRGVISSGPHSTASWLRPRPGASSCA